MKKKKGKRCKAGTSTSTNPKYEKNLNPVGALCLAMLQQAGFVLSRKGRLSKHLQDGTPIVTDVRAVVGNIELMHLALTLSCER